MCQALSANAANTPAQTSVRALIQPNRPAPSCKASMNIGKPSVAITTLVRNSSKYSNSSATEPQIPVGTAASPKTPGP